MTSFRYAADPRAVWAPPHGRLVRIPASVQDKDALLERLARGLEFPEHFGHNWDALSDCLGDLAWLGAGKVLIVHEGLPAHREYLQILRDAMDAHQDGVQQLVAVFPASELARVESLVGPRPS